MLDAKLIRYSCNNLFDKLEHSFTLDYKKEGNFRVIVSEDNKFIKVINCDTDDVFNVTPDNFDTKSPDLITIRKKLNECELSHLSKDIETLIYSKVVQINNENKIFVMRHQTDNPYDLI